MNLWFIWNLKKKLRVQEDFSRLLVNPKEKKFQRILLFFFLLLFFTFEICLEGTPMAQKACHFYIINEFVVYFDSTKKIKGFRKISEGCRVTKKSSYPRILLFYSSRNIYIYIDIYIFFIGPKNRPQQLKIRPFLHLL